MSAKLKIYDELMAEYIHEIELSKKLIRFVNNSFNFFVVVLSIFVIILYQNSSLSDTYSFLQYGPAICVFFIITCYVLKYSLSDGLKYEIKIMEELKEAKLKEDSKARF